MFNRNPVSFALFHTCGWNLDSLHYTGDQTADETVRFYAVQKYDKLDLLAKKVIVTVFCDDVMIYIDYLQER